MAGIWNIPLIFAAKPIHPDRCGVLKARRSLPRPLIIPTHRDQSYELLAFTLRATQNRGSTPWSPQSLDSHDRQFANWLDLLPSRYKSSIGPSTYLLSQQMQSSSNTSDLLNRQPSPIFQLIPSAVPLPLQMQLSFGCYCVSLSSRGPFMTMTGLPAAGVLP